MKLHEITLHEETLQQIVKRLLKPNGTLASLLGRDDSDVGAELLEAKATDKAFTLDEGTPTSKRMLSSLMGTRPHEESDSNRHGRMYTVRMPGGAKLLIVNKPGGPMAITTEQQMDQLVEGLADMKAASDASASNRWALHFTTSESASNHGAIDDDGLVEEIQNMLDEAEVRCHVELGDLDDEDPDVWHQTVDLDFMKPITKEALEDVLSNLDATGMGYDDVWGIS